ncbi:MAG: DUF4340 domain-containing protein [Bacteroidales bacterium]|jgi:hypothetical protein|nr:DUF4340 domain-containing protein [Bacteroidales bacterium]MDD4394724.1 DUF4340 domain-containing protein [Bacteroidales bacterium]
MKNRKTLITLILTAVLLLISLAVIAWKSKIFSREVELTEEMFAIQDTAQISKIFIADMHGNNVLLNKENGKWLLSDSIPIIEQKIEELIKTMSNISMQQPISEKSKDNITRMMATAAIKVEVYGQTPLFTLFDKGFFVKERKIKTYYLGPATQSNIGNYAILEGKEDTPCIVNVPGFRGFITPRFSPYAIDWISHRIFETKLTRIQKLTVKDLNNPAESYTIEKKGTRFYTLYNSANEIVDHYDTVKLINVLSEYRERNYESVVKEMTPEKKDSILQFNMFKIITLQDVNGKITELKLYLMDENVIDEIPADDQVAQIEKHFNRDRCYAILNNDTKTLYKIQYFHFDRILQPLSYFMHPSQVPAVENKK